MKNKKNIVSMLEQKDSEKIIKKINKNFKRVKVISFRLPVMNTSQNISILNQNKKNSQNLLIPIIKNFIKND